MLSQWHKGTNTMIVDIQIPQEFYNGNKASAATGMAQFITVVEIIYQ